jgi:hypothetical protein
MGLYSGPLLPVLRPLVACTQAPSCLYPGPDTTGTGVQCKAWAEYSPEGAEYSPEGDEYYPEGVEYDPGGYPPANHANLSVTSEAIRAHSHSLCGS